MYGQKLFFPECKIANSNSARKRSTREPPRSARRRALTYFFLSGAGGGSRFASHSETQGNFNASINLR